MSDFDEKKFEDQLKEASIDTLNQELTDILGYETKLAGFEEDLDSSLEEREADTRNSIARIFVSWYVFLIPFIFLVIVIFNLWIILGKPDMVEYLIPIEDTLMVLQALLGTPLGFVVGYYFKSQES